MQIIPAINETEFSEIARKMQRAAGFGATWAHIDVTDGRFTANRLWNDPKELAGAKPPKGLTIEVHLMVEYPDDIIDEWLDAGVRRIIVHVEAVQDVVMMKEKCALFGVELFLAANPDTPAEKLLAHRENADGFLVLGVIPGRSGQKMHPGQKEKIAFLREHIKNATLEVDGGVDAANAVALHAAGADVLIAASAIWGDPEPERAFKHLQALS